MNEELPIIEQEPDESVKIRVEDLHAWFDRTEALKGITLPITGAAGHGRSSGLPAAANRRSSAA